MGGSGGIAPRIHDLCTEGSGKHWVRERLKSECIVTGDVGADVLVCVVAAVRVT